MDTVFRVGLVVVTALQFCETISIPDMTPGTSDGHNEY